MQSLITEIPGLKIERKNYGNFDRTTVSGTIFLEAWEGFQSRQGPYASRDKGTPSDGTIIISVEGCGDNPIVTIEHVNAFHFLIDNQQVIKESMLNSLLIEYRNLQTLYGYDERTAKEIMPEVSTINGFMNLIGLSRVHILSNYKDGVAYVGYEFGCTWDDEHGLGIMTYKKQVIEIGGADTSF